MQQRFCGNRPKLRWFSYVIITFKMLAKLSKITHWYLTLIYKRFHMNPLFTEKRTWNSYSNKTFKTFKVYEIILNKRWVKVSWKPCLKLFLRFYGLTVFVSKNIHVCIVKFLLVFCSVFYCYFDFSKQHFTKDNNEKKKTQP